MQTNHDVEHFSSFVENNLFLSLSRSFSQRRVIDVVPIAHAKNRDAYISLCESSRAIYNTE